MNTFWAAHPVIRMGFVPAMIGVLVIGTVLSGIVTDRIRPREVGVAELTYLPKGEHLKIAVLGYRNVVADLLWIKALNIFGPRKAEKEEYLAGYKAVDVLTDLDPTFVAAYHVGGIILSIWGNLPELSNQLLIKGSEHNPTAWELPFLAGFNYYFELKDPGMGSKYLQIASAIPGGPPFLPSLAARMAVESGDPNAAMEFLERLYEQAQDERLRENLQHRMREVIAERDIRKLEEAVLQYQSQYGRRPSHLADLVASGILARIPDEPLGGAYELSEGRVKSTMLKERLTVHRRY